MSLFRERGSSQDYYRRHPFWWHQYFSDLSTFSKSQEISTFETETSGLSSTKNMSSTNQASLGDIFARQSLALLFDNSVETNELDKAHMRKILRQVPLDMLATEWLNLDSKTIRNRAYLIECILPQVVLGLEYVLKEAVSRHLVGPGAKKEAIDSEGADPNFNPINRLAEFLMRNNHKYSNFAETSPYVRGLRDTVAKLQKEMFMRSDRSLAILKAQVARKQEECAQKKLAEAEEDKRRLGLVSELYKEFLPDGYNAVEASVIRSAIKAFVELGIKLPNPIRHCLIPIYEERFTEEPPKSYSLSEFTTYVMVYAKPLPEEFFEQFLRHMKLCASEYRRAIRLANRKNILTKFFVSCDLDQVDVLSREKMRILCESYFESAPPDIRAMLRSPTDWPVKEYHSRSFPRETEYGRNNAVQRETEETVPEYTFEKNNSAVAEVAVMPSLPTQPEDVFADLANAQSLDCALIQETENNQCVDEEIGDEVGGNTALDSESQALNKINKQAEIARLDPELQKSRSFSQKEQSRQISTTDLLSALSARSGNLSRSSSSPSARGMSFGYSRQLLTLSQFLLMVDEFISERAPMELVQDFLDFLHKQYQETEEDRRNRLTQLNNVFLNERFDEVTNKLFTLLDKDCSGLINLDEVEKLVGQFMKGGYLDALKCAKHELLTKIQSGESKTNTSSNTDHGKPIPCMAASPESMAFLMPTEESPTLSENISPEIKLSKQDFRFLILKTFCYNPQSDNQCEVENLPALETMLSFLKERAERSAKERVKTAMRLQWLQMIRDAGESSMIGIGNVYKAVLQAIFKDSLEFGRGKCLGVYISILSSTNENNEQELNLKCVAAVPESNAKMNVGRRIKCSSTSVSFLALKSGQMICMPQVSAQNATPPHFLDQKGPGKSDSVSQNSSTQSLIVADNKMKTPDGSDAGNSQYSGTTSVVIPIPDSLKRFVGILGVDILPRNELGQGFEKHELEFYQGIADYLGRAYALVGVRRLLANLAATGFQWFKYHLPNIKEISLYFCQDLSRVSLIATDDDLKSRSSHLQKERQCVLYRVVTMSSDYMPTINPNPTVLTREECLIRPHLYTVADTSESCDMVVGETQFLAFPLRDWENVATGIVEICADCSTSNLSCLAEKEEDNLVILMNVLSNAYTDLSKKIGLWPVLGETSTEGVPGDKISCMSVPDILETFDYRITFESLIREDYTSIKKQLTSDVCSELTSYVDPPSSVIRLIRMVLKLLGSEVTLKSTEDAWVSMKYEVAQEMEKYLPKFDPFRPPAVADIKELLHFVSEYSVPEVEVTGSHATQVLFQWLRCCIFAFEIRSFCEQD
ncbi:unnamed protein product [Calicophoron daubneyi]|uniref:EF-hand domain-containing protein n=1 Tax=Calicophoron daubneyi TaxID=300641 RepID=A0AAV2U1R3_CALDB